MKYILRIKALFLKHQSIYNLLSKYTDARYIYKNLHFKDINLKVEIIKVTPTE